MNLGLPGNIIKVGSVREHGCREAEEYALGT